MTTTAWWMLGLTWAVITYFTAKFFWMVLTADRRKAAAEPPPGPDSSRSGA